jgi:hypothetical protein
MLEMQEDARREYLEGVGDPVRVKNHQARLRGQLRVLLK